MIHSLLAGCGFDHFVARLRKCLSGHVSDEVLIFDNENNKAGSRCRSHGSFGAFISTLDMERQRSRKASVPALAARRRPLCPCAGVAADLFARSLVVSA